MIGVCQGGVDSLEISNPTQATNVTILPDVLMQIAQLLAAQKITILPAPPPVPSGSINPLASSIEPLATSKPSTELLERIFDEDDGMSLKSLDNLVPTKTTERDLPLPSPQSTGPGEGDLVTNLEDYDYEIGEPMDPPPPMRFLSMEDLSAFVKS
ncbi:hypothetical protein Pst134EA_029326 [Puccinia striiformis f. sp. tritici]|uniref:hypothetical protein n=1 Tax=Puccinia striiformis f. sp. tritici TaxID=168172 RepID=UPI002007A1F5|nr:hypothetical protein Pst134EA_029326 [Puccinia striiformis f. sp. tritici]KAH9447292.1 hypothetical protein Pst134EA_029326 [Puccinia striiformis f. sp. tritici]